MLHRLFDTDDPDNQAGPLLLAVIIAVVVVIFALAMNYA